MAIAADFSLCLKFDAKVVYFCELRKQKIRIVCTINVNTNPTDFVHNFVVHKAKQK